MHKFDKLHSLRIQGFLTIYQRDFDAKHIFEGTIMWKFFISDVYSVIALLKYRIA